MTLPPPITSRTNARVKALRAAFSGKASRPGELVGIEGEHLIAEALRSHIGFDAIFLRQGSEAALEREALRGLDADRMVLLSASVFDSAVETHSPQGIAAMVKIPSIEARAKPGAFDEEPVRSCYLPRLEGKAPPVFVLENVQDPGNVGTLLRSAEAFGATMVVATGGCANVWSPKVIRASAGSVFRQSVLRMDTRAVRTAFEGCRIYAAVPPRPDARSLLETTFDDLAVLIVGNEGAGVSAETLAAADELVSIPCATESLNAAVAGSVMLYEAMRQREAEKAAKR